MSSSPYAAPARLLTQIWTTHKSLKTLAYDKEGKLQISKLAYAQVCHVLQMQKRLEKVLEAVGGIQCRNEGLLYVMIYELLLGPNRKIRGGGALKRQLMEKEQQLRDAMKTIISSEESPQEQQQDDVPGHASFPRYIRVNRLKASVKQVVHSLKPHFDGQLFTDPHVPDLMVLPPRTQLHDSPMVKSGKIILQDKSSCFSALCLIHGNVRPLQGDCLDACAAPGNKTSHLASLISKTSGTKVVFACDRSSTRLASLKRRMEQLVPQKKDSVRVVTQLQDFLQTKPSDYPSVRGILLDPSCSGSGIFTSLRRTDGEGDGADRIRHLANFQVTALRHAMSFPAVQRIVYSTCSIHEEENECVVHQALASSPQSDEWELVSPLCLKQWKRRGHKTKGLTKELAQFLIRADREDETNGFFVAYFERKGTSSDGNELTHGASFEKLVEPTENISQYSGQFATGGSLPSPAERNDEGPADQLKKDIPTGKIAMGKKQAKKLAWKRKQNEQKKARLLKKQRISA